MFMALQKLHRLGRILSYMSILKSPDISNDTSENLDYYFGPEEAILRKYFAIRAF